MERTLSRNRIFQYVFMFLVATFVHTHQANSQVTRYAPEVGKPHPDFVLPSIEDGKPIQLSALRGKKVLLMHFASW